jgi:integrase
MSVRKRTWNTKDGETHTAWLVDYHDGEGNRRFETFAKKGEAVARHAEVKVDVRSGVHVSASKSPTVKDAGEAWIKSAKARGLERTTADQYRQHLDLHMVPLIGQVKLAALNAATIRNFEDRLREDGRSPAMIRKVRVSLGSLIADAQERGLAAHNAVRDLGRTRSKGKDLRVEKRARGKLKVGVDIPTPGEIRAILGSAKGRWRPLLVTAVYTGLRASELRGLRWADVDFKAGELHVRQRADRFNEIGEPKSDAGHRSVPFGSVVASTLKEWKLACPKVGGLGLVFPNTQGKVENLANIINRGLVPAQTEAGIVTAKGKAKYTGMHTLRHFYASWCINSTEAGGLGLPPKVVQEQLGHSSITMTYDRYGHLFPRGTDTKQRDAAEERLIGG